MKNRKQAGCRLLVDDSYCCREVSGVRLGDVRAQEAENSAFEITAYFNETNQQYFSS